MCSANLSSREFLAELLSCDETHPSPHRRVPSVGVSRLAPLQEQLECLRSRGPEACLAATSLSHKPKEQTSRTTGGAGNRRLKSQTVARLRQVERRRHAPQKAESQGELMIVRKTGPGTLQKTRTGGYRSQENRLPLILCPPLSWAENRKPSADRWDRKGALRMRELSALLTIYGSGRHDLDKCAFPTEKGSETIYPVLQSGMKYQSSSQPESFRRSPPPQTLCFKYNNRLYEPGPQGKNLQAGVVGQRAPEFTRKPRGDEKKERVPEARKSPAPDDAAEEEEESILDGILADTNDDAAVHKPAKSSSPTPAPAVQANNDDNQKPQYNSSSSLVSGLEIVRQPNWTITPANLEEQEKLFFSSGARRNPQFLYENGKLAQRMLRLFQKPQGTLLSLAVKIIEAFLATHTSETRFLEEEGGEIVSVEETKEVFLRYIRALGLSHLITLQFSYNTVSPTTIVHDAKTGLSVIKIGLPIEYRRNRVIDVLNHEIGTHFLRKYNDQYQPWHGGRRRLGMKSCIATEEGLASLNQIYEQALFPTARPFLFKSALYYYTCCRAAEMSFVQLYQDLERYVDDPKRRYRNARLLYDRFRICLRAKRGLSDAAKLGGYYKDKVYFEGAVKILQRRRTIDVTTLFCGKVSIDDLRRADVQRFSARLSYRSCVNMVDIKLPYFMQDKEKYMRALDRIASVNWIE